MGGPVTCLALPSPAICLYSQGSFLYRCTTKRKLSRNTGHDDNNNNDDNNNIICSGENVSGHADDETNRLLVFDGKRGGNLHGIRFLHRIENDDDENNNREDGWRSSSLAVVFGGRQLAVLQNTLQLNQPMKVVTVPGDTKDTGEEESIDDRSSKKLRWNVSDWIWDVQFLLHRIGPSDDDEKDNSSIITLIVGMAHLQIQLWQLDTLTGTRHCLHRFRPPTMTMDTVSGKVGSATTTSIVTVATSMNLSVIAPSPAAITTTSSSNSTRVDHNNDDDDGTRQVVRVAAGTSRHDIFVWNVILGALVRETTPVERLQGHEGVIHAVQFSPPGSPASTTSTGFGTNNRAWYLASASDDRTIRLWHRTTQSEYVPEKDFWTLLWTGWGHSARCWSVQFVAPPSLSRHDQTGNHAALGHVVSSGEDGTLRVWEMATGTNVAVWRGHNCQSIWTVATYPQMMPTCGIVATGGNDGQVALYNVHEGLVVPWGEPMDDLSQKSETRKPAPTSWRRTFVIPDDRVCLQGQQKYLPRESQKDENGALFDSESKKIKIEQQVIVGMEIFHPPESLSPHVLVATRAGSMMSLNVLHDQWTRLESWVDAATADKNGIRNGNNSSHTTIHSVDGCCMAIHPSGEMASIGTRRGDVILVTLVPFKKETRSCFSGSVTRKVLPSRKHLAVQKLKWLNKNTLLSFHVQTMVLWTWPNAGLPQRSTQLIANSEPRSKTLRMGTKGMGISSAFLETDNWLVVGDTRGSIALFDLGRQAHTDEELAPKSVLVRVHGKEHVTDIILLGKDRILSSGNKGCLQESLVGREGMLTSLLRTPLQSFTGLERLWRISTATAQYSVVVGGYFGNIFSIRDVDKGYEFFHLDTGGRQRSFSICFQDENSLCWFAVPVVAKDGRCEIDFVCKRLCGFRTSNSRHEVICSAVEKYSLGIGPLHGETIFDGCLFDVGCDHFALLTGSEDCSARISLVRSGQFVFSKVLPFQASGARAVCHSRAPSRKCTLIAVGGGQLILQFFSVQDLDDSSAPWALRVSLICHGKPPEKAAIDHRINTIAAIPLIAESYIASHIVVAGDSNGSCYLYVVPEACDYLWSTGQLVYRSDRPITALNILQLGSHILMLAGTTAGEMKLFDISNSHDGDASILLLSHKPHQMGTNGISSKIFSRPDVLRVCSAGDDQAIYCCDIQLKSDKSHLEAAIVCSYSIPGAALSALRGIHWLNDNHILATGYDQRLSVWELLPTVRETAILQTDVGDVNSLAYVQRHGSQSLAAVVGAGVELFSLRDES